MDQSFQRFEDFQSAHGFVYGRSVLEDLERLSALSGLDASSLDKMAPRASASDPALAWSYQRMHRDPICSQCLAEGRPRRKEWRHALVTACAVHELELIDSCGACGSDLTIAWCGHASRLCGVPFSQNPRKPAEPLDVQIARYVGGMTANLAGIVIDARTDLDAVRVIWFLASGMQEPRSGKAGQAEIPKTIDEAKAFIRPISDLLLSWPTAFDVHVKARWERGDPAGLTAAQRLGPWYRGLFRLRGTLGERLIDRCHTVAGQQLGDPHKSHSAGEAAEWMSAAEAGRKIGIRAERIVHAVRANDMEGRLTRSGSGHRHSVVGRQAVEHVKALRSRHLDKTSVRELLGVSRKQFDFLEDADFFRQNFGEFEHPCVDGRYDGDALAEKLRRVRVGVKEPAAPVANVITFRELNLRRTTDRAALSALFRKIATLEIKPARWPHGAPLADAEFDDVEISTHLKQAGAARSWTAGEVAVMTGWKPECVTHWCQLGMIRAERSKRGSMPALPISGIALAEFTRTFVVVSDLAKEAGTSSPALIRKLFDLGMETTGVKSVGNSAGGHLVRQENLVKALLAAAG